MRKLRWFSALALLALAACGGQAGNCSSAFAGNCGSGGSGGGGGGGTGGTLTVDLGTGTGSSFQSGVIGISSANVSAGGSTSLSVSLVQSDGTLYTQPATINFNSPCVAAGTAAINPQASADTTTGIATVTYVAKGCSGSDVISATTTIGTTNYTASGTVTVAQAAIGSISFISATPTNIALKGTGDASRPESSTVVFKVLDASGGARSGTPVGFVLNTNVGGITLTPSTATATSDSQGLVQIVVNAGTVATSVKVTATISPPAVPAAISTQSSQLTITTGIPTANNFSMAVGCFNVEGLDVDGTTTTVTASLADRFQNPVPDGTAVTFTTSHGAIGPQCTTTTSNGISGVCTVTWRSQGSRAPLLGAPKGRVALLATAIGEESFTDNNANGSFDVGETFFDTSEPFRDDAALGANNYTAGDYFFDFNNNGTRDGPDLIFEGVLCNDPARCNASKKSAGIGVQGVIIMSGSSASIDPIDGSGNPVPPPTTLVSGNSLPMTFWIRDANSNVMPGQTTVVVTVSGTGLAVATPSAYKLPCTAPPANAKVPGATVFPFTFTSTAGTPGTAIVTVTVTSPLGLATNYQFAVVVT
jgi:hypothetical protein